MKIIKPELLAPAGTFECLKTALYFGADAVYVGGNAFGLRAFAKNFNDQELSEATDYVHNNKKKIYVTVNSCIRDSQIDSLTDYLFFLSSCGVDAVIITDPAVLSVIKDNNIKLNIHLSTQSNTFNSVSAMFWHQQGVSRIVLSRELTLKEIKHIIHKIPDSLEIEAFIHGAMCVAHSGRCLLSYAMTGRSGNSGECAQPCRWEYFLYEHGYDNQFFSISEDKHGTYILNSKDMMMIDHIGELIESGIVSFKIEGRMKSPYYVASVVNAYRRAIDEYCNDPEHYVCNHKYSDELVKSATRQFCTGFYFGKPEQDVEKDLSPFRKYAFVGIVVNDSENKAVCVEQRNKFSVGDTLEVLSPGKDSRAFTVNFIKNTDGENQDSAPHPQQIIYINAPFDLNKGDILRKEYD